MSVNNNNKKTENSRLYRSTKAILWDIPKIKHFCDTHSIPYSTDMHEKALPTPQMDKDFAFSYNLDPFLPTNLPQKGNSSILVFESKQEESQHGEVVAAIAQQVSESLQPGVDTLYIHAALNPNYRKTFEKHLYEPVKSLIENQGVPVLHTSIGWEDLNVRFDSDLNEQTDHLWNTSAYLVDSAGNDGLLGENGDLECPFQKHNALSHASPLLVRVGAAAMDEKRNWHIEGYSSANSPTLLAPVAILAKALWKTEKDPEVISGTSASAPYVSGVLAALNRRYGSYLTREQILYAVIATCTKVEDVHAFLPQTPEAVKVKYKQTAAGLACNPEYGGFGLIHPHHADKLLMQMVDLTQKAPESITIPTEERVSIDMRDDPPHVKNADGTYHYTIKMPAGFALKTTIEAEFQQENGKINITSPSGTSFPMVMSKLKFDPKKFKYNNFGMSTSHAWAGEKMGGVWQITSTTPLSRVRLNQYHFLKKDIIQDLDVPKLLSLPTPDLSNAQPLTEMLPILRERHYVHQEGLSVGNDFPLLGDVYQTINQLQTLPSGFEERNREYTDLEYKIDINTPAGELEIEANAYSNNNEPIIAAGKYLQAAGEYANQGNLLVQVNNLSMAGGCYLRSDNIEDLQKAPQVLEEAVTLSEQAGHFYHAYRDVCRIYKVLCKEIRLYKQNQQPELAEKLLEQLPKLRERAINLSQQRQGGVDYSAQRIEEGETGFSDAEPIGTDNVSQCFTIIAHDPKSLKTGLAHVDFEVDVKSLDDFFAQFSADQFGEDRLQIRLVGARFGWSDRTRANIKAVMEYLSHKHADIISADIYGGDAGPSAMVVDPRNFTLTERVPGKTSANEDISNAMIMFSHMGKPLLNQFDFTRSPNRNPIYMDHKTVSEFRQNYLGRDDAEVEQYLSSINTDDIPLVAKHINGMETAYKKQWENISNKLEKTIFEQNINNYSAQMARDALWQQSFYIGENAEAANAPLLDWIEQKMFDNGQFVAQVEDVLLKPNNKVIAINQHSRVENIEKEIA